MTGYLSKLGIPVSLYKIKIVLAIFITAQFVDSFASMATVKKNVKKEVYQGFKVFSEALSKVDSRSLRSVDIGEFVNQALKAAVAKIDPHSAFISDYSAMSDAISGNFSGIGVSVLNKNSDDEQLLIVEVLENSPAQKSGILPGDRVVGVDGQDLRGLSLDEVVTKLKGKRGTKVKLKILRNKKLIEIETVRDIIKDRSSLGYFFEDQKIYYVNLKSFSETAPKQMKSLIEIVNTNKSCKGLILDLRGNPGGIMESAIDIASLFLPRRSLVVSTKNKKNLLIGSYQTKDNPVLQRDLIIFILINNFTASAAEILAGALRHHAEKLDQKSDTTFRPLVFLLGTSTFGKGSVQEVIPLSQNCALKVTTMLYFLPDGSSVQEVGVKPDFLVLPMRSFSNEEKFLYELYGKEKSMLHHVTQGEVRDIVQKKDPVKNTVIDKVTKQKIQRLEEEKSKIESGDKEEKDYSGLDFGEIIDNLPTPSSSAMSKDEKEAPLKINYEERRQKALACDNYIQSSINMISYLDLLRRYEPTKTKTLADCKKLLKQTFISGGDLKLKKID